MVRCWLRCKEGLNGCLHQVCFHHTSGFAYKVSALPTKVHSCVRGEPLQTVVEKGVPYWEFATAKPQGTNWKHHPCSGRAVCSVWRDWDQTRGASRRQMWPAHCSWVTSWDLKAVLMLSHGHVPGVVVFVNHLRLLWAVRCFLNSQKGISCVFVSPSSATLLICPFEIKESEFVFSLVLNIPSSRQSFFITLVQDSPAVGTA